MAVKAVLRRLPCFQLAGEASSGSEAIALVDDLHPALVLMDINMPEMNGIEATRRIVAAHPDVVVFLCSTYDLADLPRSATVSGASGYVNKERFGADALRQLWQDRDSGAFARLLVTSPAPGPPPRPAPPRVRPAPAPNSPRVRPGPPRLWPPPCASFAPRAHSTTHVPGQRGMNVAACTIERARCHIHYNSGS